MNVTRDWQRFDPRYRAREVGIIEEWIIRGTSGCIAGLPGSGKSNFLGFISFRSDLLIGRLAQNGVKAVIVPIDLNDIPDEHTATFYRVLMRAFFEVRDHFPNELRDLAADLFDQTRTSKDPFIIQTHLRQLIDAFRSAQIRVVLAFDRFDDFTQLATTYVLNALRGLRDRFKGWLIYLMAMRQEAPYLADPSRLGELYEIVDTNVCWVSCFSLQDGYDMVERAFENHPLENDESQAHVTEIMALSGRYPSLLKVICNWWRTAYELYPTLEERQVQLLNHAPLIYRLREILGGLSGEEVAFLIEVAQPTTGKIVHEQRIGQQLYHKGICRGRGQRYAIRSTLLRQFIAHHEQRQGGRIWFDKASGHYYQGSTVVTGLEPQTQALLHLFLTKPHTKLTKDELILGAWGEAEIRDGVSDDSLYQQISVLRKKIDSGGQHYQYIINWRGKNESGYQFFPEGRPANV